MKYLDSNGLLYVIQKIKTWLSNKVDKVDGKSLSTNDYTTEEKNKLAGLSNYTLPTASASVKGGIKIGAGLVIDGDVVSTTGGGVADSVNWSGIQNKPTTIAGYGITDAKVSNYADYTNIALGSNNVDVLTKAKTLRQIELLNEQIEYAWEPINEHTTLIGDTTTLKTTAKDSLVNAINEVDSSIPTNNNQLTNGAGYQTASQVNAIVEGVVGSAPEALNTLKELADALGNDKDFASTMTTALSKKVNTSDLTAIANTEIDTMWNS